MLRLATCAPMDDKAEAEDREARLADALRANLRRRKAQDKARSNTQAGAQSMQDQEDGPQT